jgi:plastocyanin
MRKILFTALAVVALVGAACGNDDNNDKTAKGPSGAQSYAVDIDAAASPQFQIGAYFPGAITVRPGDTIVFTNKSKAHPHTVTLGIKADQSNRPPIITPQGVENPAAFGPCFTDTEPSTTFTACPTPPNPAAPPAFAGKGYWNSGILSTAAGPTVPGSTTVKLADSIAPGDYTFLCMLHPFMVGSLKVAAKDTDRLAPATVKANGERDAAAAVTATASLTPPAPSGNVSAGWGDRITAVMAYDPATISVKAGDTVTWKTASPYEPHTITFQSPFKTPSDKGATSPAGVKSGGTYTSGFTSSGLIGPAPFFPGNTFSLKFAKAGTYNYVCAIHPGMAGVVTVT